MHEFVSCVEVLVGAGNVITLWVVRWSESVTSNLNVVACARGLSTPYRGSHQLAFAVTLVPYSEFIIIGSFP